jgi:uncharacterized protein YunC (DUF1805 family)
MEIELIELKNGTALGLKLQLGNAPLLIIKASNGYASCSYLNIETANKLGDVAVIAKGVRNFKELLNAKLLEISEKAKERGITKEMNVKEILELMM